MTRLLKPTIERDFPTFNESEPTQNFDEDYVKMPIKESPVQDWIVDYDEWFDEFGKEQDDN